MIGIGVILLMNLALTVVGIVLGLQVKSEVEVIQQELTPLMEMAENLESSGILNAADNLGGATGGMGNP